MICVTGNTMTMETIIRMTIFLVLFSWWTISSVILKMFSTGLLLSSLIGSAATLPINSHPAHYKKCSNYVTCSSNISYRRSCYHHHPHHCHHHHHHHHHRHHLFSPSTPLGNNISYGSSIS